MLITKLVLDDFKSYQHVALTFEPGTNAILGQNGAGKSSILEAIGFALFDYRPSGVKVAGLVREGAKAGRVVVTLVSSYDERTYEVEKTLQLLGGSRYRVHDPEIGGVIAEGTSEVRAWLRTHLGLDASTSPKELFEGTIGVPQGTFTAPFLQARTARKANFDPLLQVDEYRQASQALAPTARELRERVAETTNEIAFMKGQLEPLDRYREEVQGLCAGLSTLDDRRQSLADALANARDSLRVWDQAREQVVGANAAVERARLLLQGVEERLVAAQESLAEAEAAAERRAATLGAHEAYEAAIERLRMLDAQRAERDALRQQQASLNAKREAAMGEWRRLTSRLKEIKDSEARLAELAPQVAAQEEAERALEAANQNAVALRMAQRQRRAAATERERAVDRVEACRAAQVRAAQLEVEATAAQEAADRWAVRERDLSAQRAACGSRLADAREQSARLSETTAAKCPVCEAPLTPEHRAELLARNERTIADLEQEIATLKASIAECQRGAKAERARLARSRAGLRHLSSADDLRQAEEALVRASHAVVTLDREITGYGDMEAVVRACQEALARLSNPRAESQQHQGRVSSKARVTQERDAITTRGCGYKSKLESLESELARYAALDHHIAEASATRDANRADHEAHIAALERAAQREALATRVTKQTAALASERESLEQAEASAAHAKAAYDEERHHQARQAVDDLVMRHEQAITQLDADTHKLTALKADIERLEGVAARLAKTEAKQAELASVESLAKTVRQLLSDAGPHVTRQLVHQISRDASMFYADLMDDATSRLNWSEDYELTLDIKGRTRSFQQFSGGEQMCAALALRLALLTQVSAVDIAFFDEPTAHLDPDRREGLADRIMQVKGFAQMFVISHDDTFERAAQSYVRIAKGDNGSYCEGD